MAHSLEPDVGAGGPKRERVRRWRSDLEVGQRHVDLHAGGAAKRDGQRVCRARLGPGGSLLGRRGRRRRRRRDSVGGAFADNDGDPWAYHAESFDTERLSK